MLNDIEGKDIFFMNDEASSSQFAANKNYLPTKAKPAQYKGSFPAAIKSNLAF